MFYFMTWLLAVDHMTRTAFFVIKQCYFVLGDHRIHHGNFTEKSYILKYF
jgi:hypothetical protein